MTIINVMDWEANMGPAVNVLENRPLQYVRGNAGFLWGYIWFMEKIMYVKYEKCNGSFIPICADSLWNIGW